MPLKEKPASLIGGCFIDALALIMLTVLTFYPVITSLGYDPIWFGVIIVLVTQIGVIHRRLASTCTLSAGSQRTCPSR